MSMMDPETAIEIGETLGKVSVAENTKEMVGGTFLRVRVEVDVSNSLCRGRKVAINEESEIWVSFKYEKLPNFCYWCGMVSHADKECDVWLSSKGKLRQDQQGYGNWLRALPFNPRRTTVTTVAGMGDGLGRPSSHTSASVAQSQQHTVVDKPTTPHDGRAGVGRGSAFNPDNQGSEEELQSYTCPEINAIIEESNTKSKSPMSQMVLTELDMQFNDIDSVCHKKGNGGNVHVISSESLITPRRTELNGEKVGEFNESNNSNTDCGQLNDPHAPRKWKRIEREPHVHSQPSNLQNSSEKKRTRRDEEAVLPELQNKKVHVSKAEVQEISMVEAAGQPRQDQ